MFTKISQEEQIFYAIEQLKENLSKKNPGNYFIIQREKILKKEKGLVEAYLVCEKKDKNNGLADKIFKALFPIQYEIDTNKPLVKISESRDMNDKIRNYLEIINRNHPYLQQSCEKLRKKFNLLKETRNNPDISSR
jgi:hypothetical protein